MTRPSLTIREFWQQAARLPRAALACAGLSAVVNVASYAGLTMSWAGGSLAVVHLVVMGLFLAMFVKVLEHNSLAWRNPGTHPARVSLPSRLRWAAAASLLYTIALFAWLGSTYSEGAPELRDGVEVWVAADSSVTALAPGATAAFEARTLRLFSAAWMFFALTAALVSCGVEARVRAYRAARVVAAQGA